VYRPALQVLTISGQWSIEREWRKRLYTLACYQYQHQSATAARQQCSSYRYQPRYTTPYYELYASDRWQLGLPCMQLFIERVHVHFTAYDNQGRLPVPSPEISIGEGARLPSLSPFIPLLPFRPPFTPPSFPSLFPFAPLYFLRSRTKMQLGGLGKRCELP